MIKATIAVFAKEPVPGIVKTRLIPPLDSIQAAGFADVLLRDTIKMVKSLNEFDSKELYYYPLSGKNYFKKITGPGWNIKLQEGKDLGERLNGAFNNILKKNGPPAVIIGTDSPGLPVNFLYDSIQGLRDRDIIIGPSTDGGFYLVGISGYFPQLFENIRWSTSNAYNDLVRNINSLNLTFNVLPEWHDIDNIKDLMFFIKKMKDLDKNYWRHTKKFLSNNNILKQFLSRDLQPFPFIKQKTII